jgi:hypothetical protein
MLGVELLAMRRFWSRFKAGLANAFAYDDGRADITQDDLALLDKVAEFVVRRRLTTPAILLLESTGPLNFVGASLMSFFRPILSAGFKMDEYEKFERLLEKRCSLPLLTERIELCERRHKKRAQQNRDHAETQTHQTSPGPHTG